jgi:hypothetical protein
MIIASENVWLFIDALIPGRSTVYCSVVGRCWLRTGGGLYLECVKIYPAVEDYRLIPWFSYLPSLALQALYFGKGE